MTAEAIDILVQSLHIFFACVALAFVEINVEGAHGWAKNLPTWRGQPAWAKQGSLFFRGLRAVYGVMSGGNELTGYHLSLISFLVLIIMLPVSFAENKLLMLATCAGWFAMMCVVWDFLWFVFNPAYGVARFKPANIAWHPRWIGPMPIAYYGGVVSGVALIDLGTGDIERHWWIGLVAAGVQAVGVALCVALSFVWPPASLPGQRAGEHE